jgi:hypothetical protein
VTRHTHDRSFQLRERPGKSVNHDRQLRVRLSEGPDDLFCQAGIIALDALCEHHLKGKCARASRNRAARCGGCMLVVGLRRRQGLFTFLASVECLIDLPTGQGSFGIDFVWSIDERGTIRYQATKASPTM